jgi:nitrite reductase (NADH) small subunit
MSDEGTWIDVGAVVDIPRRGARRVKTPGLVVAVFRTVDDAIYALEDRCPHKGGPLSQGIVHDCAVTCPLHNWVVDLKSGAAREDGGGSVTTIPVRIREGRVLLDLKLNGVRAA